MTSIRRRLYFNADIFLYQATYVALLSTRISLSATSTPPPSPYRVASI